jgi:hypothetical protein
MSFDTPPPPERAGPGLMPIDDATRRAYLAQAVANQVRYGSRVESQMDFQTIMVAGKPVNHVLHLLLTLFTCLWGIVWLILIATGGEKRYALTVDNYGHILRS